MRVRLAGAQAVHLLGRFNNWSTTATPMRRSAEDVWEAVLPVVPEPGHLRFFIWRPGDISGRMCHAEAHGE